MAEKKHASMCRGRYRAAISIRRARVDQTRSIAVEAPDARTLRVKLRAPCPYFLDLVAFPTLMPVPVEQVEKFGDRWVLPENIRCNGPFMLKSWDRGQAIKRGGDYQFISLDQETAEAFYDAPSASDSTSERVFDARWARTLTAGALNSLREELLAEGKAKLFEQLKSFLAGGSVVSSYDEASARTGLPRATVKTHVHRLRQRYREIVRREIARTVSAPHEIDEELRYLCSVLAEAA